jgi:hypothetical protein
MDAGPDALHHQPPLGSSAGDADLGPISPELALIDPELARRARELLPEPRERPRPSRPPRPLPAPEPEAQPPERRRRRWPQTIALAIVIFVAGAASGTLLGNHQTGSPATTLEVRAVGPATSQTTAPPRALRPPKAPQTTTTAPAPQTTTTAPAPQTTTTAPAPQTTTTAPAPRPSRDSRTTTAAAAPPQRRRHARVDWATNVLGVEARVGRTGVALQWLRPADSGRVLVLRRREGRPGATVVYRGRAARFRDSSVRACTAYRYTIVNVDRQGHRSTGVPTSVVTLCA